MAEMRSEDVVLRQQRLRFTPTHVRNPLRARETERHARGGRKRTLSPELTYEGDAEMSEVECSPCHNKADQSPWAQLSAIGTKGLLASGVGLSPRPNFSFSQRKKARTDAIPISESGIAMGSGMGTRMLSPSPVSIGLQSCPVRLTDAPQRQSSLETHPQATTSAPASPCGMSWMPSLGELTLNQHGGNVYSECG